jgi:hypothetical protein
MEDETQPPSTSAIRSRARRVGIAFAAAWLTLLLLGFGFLFIFMGLYGLLLFMMPYSPPLRRLVETLFGFSLAKLHRPIPGTPWPTLVGSTVLLLIRLLMIIAGVFVLRRLGIQCQNFIFILFGGKCL